MSLIDTNYVATDSDIKELTKGYVLSVTTADASRSTYLRALIATTQKELGANPARKNNGRAAKLSDEDQKLQLEALTKVHERFYQVIHATVEETLTDVPAKDRAVEKNRRTNFARTALYAARTYIRAGKDLTALAPGKVTKTAIAVNVAPRTPTVGVLKNRVERASKDFVTQLLALSETDKEAAQSELDTLIGIMATQFAALGVPMARDIETAAREHRPFRRGDTVFVPTDTTVLQA